MTPPKPQLWSERADDAEDALITRHLRRVWCVPGTRLGVVAWPAGRTQRVFSRWDYWWQAHLLDCAVDAADRRDTPERRTRIAELALGIRLRNLSGWTNKYYDDMAWLALALERAERVECDGDLDYQSPLRTLGKTLYNAWNAKVGAIPWRVNDIFYNTPANGPAGIILARLGSLPRAVQISDWIAETLWDSSTGLIFDGIRIPPSNLERAIYTYCQGVTIGLDTELAVRTGEPRFVDRAVNLIVAVEENLTVDAAIDGGGGGDGGLFNGILSRYLALAALMLPGDTPAVRDARARAAAIVLASADAAWNNRLDVNGSPLFGPNWRRPAQMPGAATNVAAFIGGTVLSSEIPERDLSVQTGGWMVLEAAYRVAAAGF